MKCSDCPYWRWSEDENDAECYCNCPVDAVAPCELNGLGDED